MPVYSHSKLETFETCPLKYKFRYIDKLEKPEVEGVEAFVGKRVHEVLQHLYDELLFGPAKSVHDLLACYKERWEKEWGPEVQIVDTRRSAGDYFSYGAECIRTYYERNKPFQESRTLATEARLDFLLDRDGRYRMTGYVDRIARRDDGTYEIHDYKTSRSVPPQSEADTSRQLALYQIGLGTRWKDAERVELVWHYLRFGVALRSTRTEKQLVQLRETTAELIDRIENTKNFEPRKSRLCDWCEFKPDCPLWKHVVKVEALPKAKLKADSGVKLADAYAGTKLEIDRLQTLLADIREQIVDFAQQQGVSVIQGSGARISVSIGERVVFPGKKEPERAQLELFLEKAGRWKEVAVLSDFELRRILEEEAWPEALLKKLGTFARTEPTASVRVHSNDHLDEDDES